MLTDPPTQPDKDAPEQALSPEADAKRRAARRRFLVGASAGSGLVITTLYHQRSMAAAKRLPGTYLVSSQLACTSIGGISSATTDTSVMGRVRTKCVIG